MTEDTDYAVYTLDMASAGIDADTTMYISGAANAVDVTDGANYIIKLYNGVGFVAFEKDGEIAIHKVIKDSADGDITVTFVNYAGKRVSTVDMLTAADFADGIATVSVEEGCTAKIITLENAETAKPVFADITIG